MNALLPQPQEYPAGWQRLARRTALRVNAGWWLSCFAPLLMAASIAGCAALLLLRSSGITLPALPTAAGIAGAVALSALAAWIMARRHFCTPGHALVRLEMQLGLHNALSAAAQGVIPWPAPPAQATDALSANLRRVVPPLAGAAALIAAGLLIPLSPVQAEASPPLPRSHTEIQSAIDLLKEAEAIKQEDLEKLQRQLDNLSQQGPGEWYSHHNLEAADSLRESMQQSLREMAQNLDKGAAGLNALSTEAESSPEQRAQAAADFQQALQGLQNSPLGLNQKLMEQLSKVNPASLKSLNEQQLEELKEGMKECAGACKAGSGTEGSGKGQVPSDGDGAVPGEGEGEGVPGRDGTGHEKPGRGGVQRGPGVAPLPLAREATPEMNGTPSALESNDLTRARPGDLFGTSEAQHKPDKTSSGPQSGGSVTAPGSGGAAVGRESLLPSDRAVLKRYFQ